MKHIGIFLTNIILVISLSGCQNATLPIMLPIVLTAKYQISADDPYPDNYRTIHYAPYLKEKAGVYGDDNTPWYSSISQLSIWTLTEDKVYMLGSSNTYFLLDRHLDELSSFESLEQFSEGDQNIFEKLKAHPELFADIQEISSQQTTYRLNGKGQVNLDDLD